MAVSLADVRSDAQFKALTTINRNQFEYLNIFFSATYKKIYGVSIEDAQQNLSQNFVFPTTKHLLFYTLFCLKNNLILSAMSFTFGIDESSANYNFKKGIKILHDTFIENELMPARNFETGEEFIEYFKKEGKLILDATEFKIQRPSDAEKQKEMYSGKKKSIAKRA